MLCEKFPEGRIDLRGEHMKKGMRWICLLLALSLLAMSGCGSTGGSDVSDGICASPARTGELASLSDEAYFADFTPVMRFAVASDVHVADLNSKQEEERLAQLFDVAYNYADNYDGYTGLDAAFFVGDVSDRGTPFSLQRFFLIVERNVREGTQIRATMGNHEYYDMADVAEWRFLDASDYEDTDAHLVIGGYHFIFLSPDGNGKSYSKEKQDFLAASLEEAAKDDATGCKPIFVFQHHPVSNTVYGSTTSWGVEELTSIIEKYPQVVDFSGHSHFPMNDPRSIWQGEFTALGCGTLSYYEMDLAGVKGDYVFATDREGGWAEKASGVRDAGQFYIVEVDANHAIRVLGYDLLSDGWMMDPITIRCVDEKSCFTYTNARADVSDAPVFSADAVVTEEKMTDGRPQFRFPQAVGEDLVQHYVCTLYSGGKQVAVNYRLACTCYLPVPETLTVYFAPQKIQSGQEYRLEITPVNAWAVKGEPLVYTFTAK